LKLKKRIYVCTLSSASIAKESIKLTVTHTLSINIVSIKNGIQRSIKNSMKIKANQFAQL